MYILKKAYILYFTVIFVCFRIDWIQMNEVRTNESLSHPHIFRNYLNQIFKELSIYIHKIFRKIYTSYSLIRTRNTHTNFLESFPCKKRTISKANWDKVLKSGLSKFRERQPLKNLLCPICLTYLEKSCFHKNANSFPHSTLLD